MCLSVREREKERGGDKEFVYDREGGRERERESESGEFRPFYL